MTATPKHRRGSRNIKFKLKSVGEITRSYHPYGRGILRERGVSIAPKAYTHTSSGRARAYLPKITTHRFHEALVEFLRSIISHLLLSVIHRRNLDNYREVTTGADGENYARYFYT